MTKEGRHSKAYAYLRVSAKEQLFGNRFDRQLKTIEHFCSVSQYRVEKIDREQVSGTEDEKNRPEMSAMIADIMPNGCNTIIVEDLSRLARECRVQENIILYRRKVGVENEKSSQYIKALLRITQGGH